MKTKKLGLGEGSLEGLAQMASRNKKAVPFLIHAVKEWATLLVLLPACLAGYRHPDNTFEKKRRRI